MRKIILPLLLLYLIQTADWLLIQHLVLSQKIYPGFCQLGLVWNRGVAFGWFTSTGVAQNYLLLIFLCLLCLIILHYLLQLSREEKRKNLIWSLILSGGVSNLLHRVNFDAVPDLLSCPGLPSVLGQLQFNSGDIALVLGCAAALLTTETDKKV